MTDGLRVGLYDRALSALGGGERFALGIAEYLARKHDVTVLTHRPTSRDEASQRLGIDLSRVMFLAIPERSAAAMSPVTAGYDVFILASHGEYVPCQAATGILVVHFPQAQAAESPGLRLRRRLKRLLRDALMQPLFEEGVFAIQTEGDTQTRLLAERTAVRLPPAPRGYALSFRLAAADSGVTAAAIEVNGEAAGLVPLPADGSFVPFDVGVRPAGVSAAPRLVIRALQEAPAAGGGPRLRLSSLHVDDGRYRFYESLLQGRWPAWGLSLQYVPPVAPLLLPAIGTYKAIWASSLFAQTWIGCRWRRESELLYPAVDTDCFSSGPKRQQVLSVGRFFVGHHNKKHGLMVNSFRQMVDAGLSGWELHLAGGTMPGASHERYLTNLQELVKGYPIRIHPDVSAGELTRLYDESSIYWHAGGFGEDEERHPERLEHFGITTVEAMAAGCVPVVIAKGGQPEIVQDGRNGMLWRTTEDLKRATWRLIREPGLRRDLSAAAREDSKRFGQPRFESRLHELLGQIGVA